MQICTTLLRLSMPIWFLLVMVPRIWAAPGFDLDLKELKKPSSPPPVATKKAVAAAVHKKQPSTAQKQVLVVKKQKTVPQKQTATVVASVPVVPSELALKGGNACQLAERMAVAVARSITDESALNGLDLKPVATVSYGGLKVLITCGLAPAEAYTFARLLEGHQLQLLNIGERETTAQVAQGIVNALALPYLLEKDESAKEGDMVYLFPPDSERQRPLRLILHP